MKSGIQKVPCCMKRPHDVDEGMSLDRAQAHEIVEAVRRWAADHVR